MNRNENKITENSKTEYVDKSRYKNIIFKNNPHNISIPFNLSNKGKLLLRNKENSFNNKNFQDLTNSSNNEFIKTIPSNGLINITNLPKGDYIPRKDYKNKKMKNTYKQEIYINNYNPRKKKCKIARNYDDITKYFSKDYKRTKITNDIILTDFDTNNSKNNNIFYLINNYQLPCSNINKIYNNEDNDNIKHYKINNNVKKLTKISLPFCIYDMSKLELTKQYIHDCKNCPGCIYCLKNKDVNNDNTIFDNQNLDNEQFKNEDEENNNILYKNLSEENKLDNSFEDNPLDNQRKLSAKLIFINEKYSNKHSLIEEENKDESQSGEKKEEESDEIQNESSKTNEIKDIDNELIDRGDINIHNLINRIRLPHEPKCLNDKNKKKNKLNLPGKFRRKKKGNNELNSRNDIDNKKNQNFQGINNSSESYDSGIKSKSSPKINDSNREDDDKKKKLKFFPKSNSCNEKSKKKIIKIKKIELLRE